jgi:hypothetical protein
MSFLDLYQGDIDEASKIQPNEGTSLPSGIGENFSAAWSDGLLFSQSTARDTARAGVLQDYVDEIRQKTGQDLSKELNPDANSGSIGPSMFDQANARVAAMKQDYPDLDLAPLSEDEINQRAVAKAQAAHRDYAALQSGEKTTGGSVGSFFGSAFAGAADPINIVGMAVAPEAAGIGVLSTALRWGALAGVSQAAIEFQSDQFKEQVQPGYQESGQPIREIGGAFLGGAAFGGGIKALGNAWTRVKTGAWPTSVRDAGNVIESEANVAQTNIFPGAEGEVAHREALTKTIDDILAGRPVDVGAQITPELAAHIDAYHGSPHDFEAFDMSKMGTGEGGQAYGHGMYFAENPSTAEAYSNVKGANENDGNIYRVKITADKDRMLDWDKPLSEQPEAVKQVFAPYVEQFGGDAQMPALIKIMSSRGAGMQGVSEQLREAGVPGIKYLDQGSRTEGEGSRNYVVFDDKHLQITHKNGKPINAETRQNIVDQAMGLPPKQPELPLEPATSETVPPEAPSRVRVDPNAPQPALQTPDQMAETLAAPDHQDAIRADIDRARAMSDVQVPGIDENGNHTMLSVDAAMDQVDAYKALSEHIQACAAAA